MKKIVGIIAALALAGAVFADEPDVVPSVSSFKGDASIEWIADLDAETTGMKNSESAEFKIIFVPETKKKTEGEGLWGELEIKVGKVEVTGGKGFGTIGWELDDDKNIKLDDDGHPILTAAGGSVFIVPSVSVETAKIHFTDDDFYAVMNIKAPGLKVGGGKYVLATRSDDGGKANPEVGVTLTGAQGFTLNFGLKDLVDFNVQFADNGQQKGDAKKFAFVFDASLKAVENLDLTAGVGYSTEEEKAAIGVKAAYKVAISDTMYVKPSVGFTLKDKAKALGAAVMFGWGKENQEPKFAKFTNDVVNIGDKCSDGVSFYLNSNLESKDKGGTMGFLFGVYDETLLAGFLPGLKVAADFQGDFNTIGDAFELNAALKYSNTFDIWTIDANFGMQVKKGAETNTGVLYGFGVSTDNSLIQNTKLYVKYAGENAAKIGGADKKGSVTLGAQIHF